MVEYNGLAKALHFLALGQQNIAKATLEIELGTFGNRGSDVRNGEHIFVTGLARSGTTIVTRSLHDIGHFSSLTYKDMPFVLAPNYWSKLSKYSRRHTHKTERAHRDRIYIDYDSPEAFDEVFWKTCLGEHYINSSSLTAHNCDPQVIEKFIKYVGLILHCYGNKRYLSKNNNNVLRITSLIKAFPNAFVIIPFREPLQQAASLLNQHMNFLGLHQQEPFIKQYMDWLGHCEFGPGHKPFRLTEEPPKCTDALSIEYWLEQWFRTYQFLLCRYTEFPDRIILVCYEKLCNDSKQQWNSLLQQIGIKDRQKPPSFEAGEAFVTNTVQHDQLTRAKDLYSHLRSVS